jgi:hypothetical protein
MCAKAASIVRNMGLPMAIMQSIRPFLPHVGYWVGHQHVLGLVNRAAVGGVAVE